jgi:uncharacterized damage-inducible protein DinB
VTTQSIQPGPPLVPVTRTARLVAELRRESESTRRVLERVPEDRLEWRPHPRSMTLGQLALHLARLPLGIAMLVERLRVELPTVPLDQPHARAELTDALARSVEYAEARLDEWGDAGLDEEWTLQQDGTTLFTQQRGEIVRTLMLNHSYHHRGQLLVYLRLLDLPLPPIYGPTADENPFA